MSTEFINVDAWPKAVGYSNGRIGNGRPLHIAGQIGWTPHGVFESDDFVLQFAQALDNVIAVLHAAHGRHEDIATMTIYVTDMEAYRARRRDIGPIWRARFQNHYPAMAVIGVSSLVEPQALLEICCIAYLEHAE
jgi:enamine deaminase RidA (YjgF/YER057c/UK114 family)|nr:RidA family protein [Kofleriaceae bacterium]